MNQFRIGACYRQRNGVVVRLVAYTYFHGRWSAEADRPPVPSDMASAVRAGDGAPLGSRSLETGSVSAYDKGPFTGDLLPGEVDEQGNPITEEPGYTREQIGQMLQQERAAEEPKTTYEDVRARVIALAKISRETALQALSVFEVDKAFNLRPDQWLDFVQFADGWLAVHNIKQFMPAADPNAAMLARDAAAIARKQPKPVCEPHKAAKPHPLTLSPDLKPAGHQVSPVFGSAWLGMDRG